MQGRSESLKAVIQQEFDLAVIGGGLMGAAVAQNAASRGLSVVLIEKVDFGAGASSKSAKLIDGGLYEMESKQFGKIARLCRERSLLEQLAPHMIKDTALILPIVSRSSGDEAKPLPSWKLGVAASIYDLLAWNVKGGRRNHSLDEKEVVGSVPALSNEKITGGMRLHECFTDDARLVLELVKSACSLGAVAVNYLSAQSFVVENGRVSKIICRDRFEGRDIEIACRSCVNAAGVWSDQLTETLRADSRSRTRAVKSVHVVVPNSAFETNSAVLLPAGDGRYAYVFPWQKALMIGSTGSAAVSKTDVDNRIATEEEIAFLLNTINRYVREDRWLSRRDVIATWAGFHAVETEVYDGPCGIVGISGGRLNEYRLTADKVVDRVLSRRPAYECGVLKPASTDKIMLGGWSNKEDYLTSSAEISARARRLSVEPGTIDHLCQTYGKDALKVLDVIESDSHLNKRICPDYPPVLAEIAYTVKHEMAMSLEDALFRRVRLGHVNQKQCLAAASKVARLVQGTLGWDDARTAAELKFLTNTLEEHLHIEAVAQLES